MNLRRLNRGDKFVVGNLNDYLNIINKTNVRGNSRLQVSDLQELENEYNNLTLSYSIETNKNSEAVRTFVVNDNLFLNIYLI